MFEYFYHGTVRKTIVAFANLFNDIHIARYDIAGGNDASKLPERGTLCNGLCTGKIQNQGLGKGQD
jgi:hypothetical protein